MSRRQLHRVPFTDAERARIRARIETSDQSIDDIARTFRTCSQYLRQQFRDEWPEIIRNRKHHKKR